MGVIGAILQVLQLLAAIGVIVLVLIQHGKGADMGAAFGSGASGSLFGASGSANFLSRATAVLATIFFVCTLGLAMTSHQSPKDTSAGVMSTVPATSGSASDRPAATPPPDAGKANEIPK